MAQDALNVYATLSGTSVKAKLKEVYAGTIDGLQKKALSVALKNTRYSGDPKAGSVRVSRFVNSNSKTYGTARAAGKGDPLRDLGPIINLDTPREIITEFEKWDIEGLDAAGVVANRTNNHDLTMVRELDTAFFAAIEAVAGAEVTLVASDNEGKLEELIQSIETLSNDYVNGVDRDLMTVSLKPSIYGQLRTKFDTIEGQRGEEFVAYHGVKVVSNTRQTKDFILVVEGAVAQPVAVDEYVPNRIPFSNAASIDLFYKYGTKVVAEDLVAWAGSASS